jgi:hypothetical protein
MTASKYSKDKYPQQITYQKIAYRAFRAGYNECKQYNPFGYLDNLRAKIIALKKENKELKSMLAQKTIEFS